MTAYYTDEQVGELARANVEQAREIARLTDALRLAHDVRPETRKPAARKPAGARRRAGTWKYRMADDPEAGFVAADYYGRAWTAPAPVADPMGATSRYIGLEANSAELASLRAEWRTAHHEYALAVAAEGADSAHAKALDNAAALVLDREQRIVNAAVRTVAA